MKSGITVPRWWGPTMFAKRKTQTVKSYECAYVESSASSASFDDP